jgi:predicted transcriptional regulator
LELTKGHPFLLQLLCSEIVAHKNQQPLTQRRLASVVDVENAAALALEHAAFFFGDLEYNQVTEAGRALLRFIAEQGAGVTAPTATLVARYPHQLQEALQLLLRRDLIEPHNDGYRFQVELIRRWFARPTAP